MTEEEKWEIMDKKYRSEGLKAYMEDMLEKEEENVRNYYGSYIWTNPHWGYCPECQAKCTEKLIKVVERIDPYKRIDIPQDHVEDTLRDACCEPCGKEFSIHEETFTCTGDW